MTSIETRINFKNSPLSILFIYLLYSLIYHLIINIQKLIFIVKSYINFMNDVNIFFAMQGLFEKFYKPADN